MRQKQPKKDEENRLAKEAAGADAAEKAEEECAAREAVRQETQAAQATRMAKNSALPLKLRRKPKRNTQCIAGPCRTSHLSKEAAALATVSTTEAALGERLLGLKEMMAYQCC